MSNPTVTLTVRDLCWLHHMVNGKGEFGSATLVDSVDDAIDKLQAKLDAQTPVVENPSMTLPKASGLTESEEVIARLIHHVKRLNNDTYPNGCPSVISLIKLVRERGRMGLKDAKDLVDRFLATL